MTFVGSILLVRCSQLLIDSQGDTKNNQYEICGKRKLRSSPERVQLGFEMFPLLIQLSVQLCDERAKQGSQSVPNFIFSHK